MTRCSEFWPRWKRSIYMTCVRKKKSTSSLHIFRWIIWIKILKRSFTWGRTSSPTSLPLSMKFRKMPSTSVLMSIGKRLTCSLTQYKKRKISSNLSPLMTKINSEKRSKTSKTPWKTSGEKKPNPNKNPPIISTLQRKITLILPLKQIKSPSQSRTCTKCFPSLVLNKSKVKGPLGTCSITTKTVMRPFPFLLLSSRKSEIHWYC